jgi:lipopolysaccharide transport protein LptA
MKIFLLLALVIVLPGGLSAQTNEAATNAIMTELPEAPVPDPAATNQIVIESIQAELRTDTNYTAIYSGNVRATYGDARLTCDTLTIRADKGAERPEYILADRNVVIDHKSKNGNPIHATGDRAVYTVKAENSATNEVVVLSGDARVLRLTWDADVQRWRTNSWEGETVRWNLTTENISSSGGQTTIISLPDDATSKLPFGRNRTNTP